MAKVYVEKQRRVNAEQFFVAVTPWPPGVIEVNGQPMVQFPSGLTVPIHDTEWLTVDVRSGALDIVSDADFQDQYGAGPT